VEWAETLVARARLAELDRLTDELDQTYLLLDLCGYAN
jgi:hypothetical protein